MRILAVIGTRPEAIKMAPVIGALRARPGVFHPVSVCLTGQHRDLAAPVMRLFGIPVDTDLDLMRPGQTVGGVTGAVLTGLGGVIERETPDMVLFHGDTTTAFAAALAAYYARVPSAHVEAGLRTGDKHSPFPEEMNRRLADTLCDWHYAPTPAARENLLREDIPDASVLVTGNTIVDALRQITAQGHHFDDPALEALGKDRPLVVVTAHRRESFGAPMENICRAVAELARRNPGADFLFPVHPNPNVRAAVDKWLAGTPGVRLVPPMDYLAFAHLLGRARVALTDSGGIQEEAPSLGVPVLVMRDVTERPEAVAAGTARLVGTDLDRIVGETETLLRDGAAHAAMTGRPNPYGDGRAAERIADHLASLAEERK